MRKFLRHQRATSILPRRPFLSTELRLPRGPLWVLYEDAVPHPNARGLHAPLFHCEHNCESVITIVREQLSMGEGCQCNNSSNSSSTSVITIL